MAMARVYAYSPVGDSATPNGDALNVTSATPLAPVLPGTRRVVTRSMA